MKYLLFFLTTIMASAGSIGSSDVTVSNVAALYSYPIAGTIFVSNTGTNTVFVNFGGHTAGATNDAATDYRKRFPIRAATSYTTRGKYSVVSLFCSTGIYWSTTFDIACEGD